MWPQPEATNPSSTDFKATMTTRRHSVPRSLEHDPRRIKLVLIRMIPQAST